MIGSYGPKDKPHEAKFLTEESPSGFMARSGSYEVRSKIIDDDGVTRAGEFYVVIIAPFAD